MSQLRKELYQVNISIEIYFVIELLSLIEIHETFEFFLGNPLDRLLVNCGLCRSSIEGLFESSFEQCLSACIS